MNKSKPVIARNTAGLAKALGLSDVDAIEMDVRMALNDKIIEAVRSSGLTHAQVASAAATSRTRITAILNRDRTHVSTDLMLRILAALGYRAKIRFTKTKRAA